MCWYGFTSPNSPGVVIWIFNDVTQNHVAAGGLIDATAGWKLTFFTFDCRE